MPVSEGALNAPLEIGSCESSMNSPVVLRSHLTVRLQPVRNISLDKNTIKREAEEFQVRRIWKKQTFLAEMRQTGASGPY